MRQRILRSTPAAELEANAPRSAGRGDPVGCLQRSLGNRATARWFAQGGRLDPAATHQVARAGLRGGGGQLPHLDAIQRSFGGHDVRGVSAHRGELAARASRAIGAEAYTAGNDVAFAARSPSLHTAAHEAAHVIQQRAGVNLRDGLGAEGDGYERHADAVADLVVRGQSAERLLSAVTRRGADASGGPAVQRAAFDRPLTPATVGGWKIDHDEVPDQEILVSNGQNLAGSKTTRLTALLSPTPNIDAIGRPTAQGYNPLGWSWVESNEARTKSNKLRYWVRFHLLSASLGGDGHDPAHLTPTDKSTNSQWDINIEEPMKAKIRGGGTLTNPRGVPLYYDVNVTYWNSGDAPSTYDLTGVGGADYSSNMALFPKQIDATWSTFEKNGWVAQTPVSTGQIPKPAGVGGSDVDLTSGMTNFSGIKSIYGIDEEILGILVTHVLPKSPRTYRDVRLVLEQWVAGATTSGGFVSRSSKLYLADAKLRAALDGKGPLKLKLGGATVPDDATPEARQFQSPAATKDLKSSRMDTKVIDIPVSKFNTAHEDPIRSGYYRVSKNYTQVPRAYDVLSAAVTDTLDRVTLRQVNEAWDHYLDNNDSILPMLDSAFAGEGTEVAQVVFDKTMSGLEQHVRGVIGFKNQDTDTDRLRSQVIEALQLGTPGGWLQQHYWQVLCAHGKAGVKDYLNVEHAAGRNFPALYTKLLANEPALAGIKEGLARVNVVRDALFADLPVNRSTFPSLPGAPWSVALNVAIADQMRIDLENALHKKSRDQKQDGPSKKVKFDTDPK